MLFCAPELHITVISFVGKNVRRVLRSSRIEFNYLISFCSCRTGNVENNIMVCKESCGRCGCVECGGVQ